MNYEAEKAAKAAEALECNVDAAQRELDARASQGEDVSSLYVNAQAVIVSRKRQAFDNDYNAQQAAKASAAAALQAANKHLVAVGSVKGGSLQAAAKNIRIELALAYPGVKFSVKSKRFSMGDDISVHWVDGPCAAQVGDIIDRYSAGDFSGMDDSYSYRHNAWIDAFGDAKYVFAHRDSSDKAVESAIRYACAKWGWKEAVSVEEFRKGKCWSKQADNFGNYNLGDLIHQELSRRCWALNKAPKAAAMVESSSVLSALLDSSQRLAANGEWLQ